MMNRMTLLVLMLALISLGLAAAGCDKPASENSGSTPAQQTASQPSSPQHVGRNASNPLEAQAPPVAMAEYSPQMEDGLSPELLGLRVQPAVYRIVTYGDIELTVPQKVEVDVNALEAEWRRTAPPYRMPTVTKQHFYWQRIIEEPDKYIIISAQTEVRQRENVEISGGTGFLISRDGIVVTNAHVVSDVGPEPCGDDPRILVSIFGQQVTAWVKTYTDLFGAGPDQEQEAPLAQTLLLWLRNHSSITGKFREAKLAMNVARKQADIGKMRLTMNLQQMLNQPAVVIVAPMKVLKKGEVIPGKDVAILQAENGDWNPVERAICLPLGDSDEVLPTTKVQAFGFPSKAFNEAIMEADAGYRVTIQDGQIGNTKAMRGGWSAFEMTADINHGDSGGPVVDPHGRVIAINAGSAQGLSSHTLAVPIDLARQMLKELNIKPDPGPVTALWISALNDYQHGRYAEAKTKLDVLQDIQTGRREANGALPPLSSPFHAILSEKLNPYVGDMLGRVLIKLDHRT
jgi:S1-C subfamily serine protease